MKYLIVDDHPLVLKALEAVVIGEGQCLLASTMQQCLDLIHANPDIDLIMLDLCLPDSNGPQGVFRVRTAAPGTPILVLSGNTDAREIKQTMDYGAAGFVIKSTDISVLRKVVALILSGGTYIPSEIFGSEAHDGNQVRDKKDAQHELTQREKEVLSLVAQGLSNKAIAYQIALSENTVRVHVARLMKKIGVSNRTQAASMFLLNPMQKMN